MNPWLLLCKAYLCPTIGWIIFPCFRHHLLYAQFLQLFLEELALNLHFRPWKIRYELQVAFPIIWAYDLFGLLLIGQMLWCFFRVFRGGGIQLLQISRFPSTILEHFHAVFTPSFSPLLRTRVGNLIWFCGEGLIQGGQFVRETNFLGFHVKTSGKHVIMCFASI